MVIYWWIHYLIIQNNQGLSMCYKHYHLASADSTNLALVWSGYLETPHSLTVYYFRYLFSIICSFQLSDNASWRGTPSEYVVLCNYYLWTLGSLPNCEYYVPAMANRAVLPRLDSAKSYLVYIKMCNEETICSTNGEPHIIKELQGGLRKAGWGLRWWCTHYLINVNSITIE